jgi:biotin synthase
METSMRHDWRRDEVQNLFELPFADLIYRAQQVHRANFDHNQVQISTLLSIKTGACPENCAYCPQSVHHSAEPSVREALMSEEQVLAAAKKAKASGASRFCMGAGWREPKDKDLQKVISMIKGVKALGMETCVTLGMLSTEQVEQLASAGLDYYNHNLDTSPEYYQEIISSRTYQDRLDTLERLRQSSIHVCCGGIIGMGEKLEDRVGLLCQLANLPEHPGSVPINMLVSVPGTPLENTQFMHPIDFARTIAVARIMMPKSMVRLSAGRTQMSDELQALCFLAGANSIHYGEKLLTTPLPDTSKDQELLQRLGINAHLIEQQAEATVAEML